MVVLQHPRIIAFYESHPHIDAEKVNIVFIDLMEKILDGISPTLGETAVAEILGNIRSLRQQMGTLADDIAALPRGTGESVIQKITECSVSYIDELRTAVSTNIGEKVEALVERGNAAMHDKLRIVLAETISPTNDALCSRVRDMIHDIHAANSKEAKDTAAKGVTESSLTTMLAAIDGNFTRAIANMQTALAANATERDARVAIQLAEIREANASHNTATTQLCSGVGDLLKKMENSSTKGKISETILYNTLVQIFPSAHVDHVGGMKESGDIIVRRKNRAPVLVENKCYDRNIAQDEINKFYRDVDSQDMSGLFISQRTGIVGKSNFEIEVRGDNILLFIHNLEYDADKLKVAFNILDHFRTKMDEMVCISGGVPMHLEIDKSIMDSVNQEYRDFALSKLNHIRTIKEYTTKMVAQTDAMRLPNLEGLLLKHYSPINGENEFVCQFCNFVAKNSKSLAAHLRGCATRKCAVKNDDIKNDL